MIALANERGGEDNETVIVADVLGEDLAEVDEYETVTSTFEVLQAFEARPTKQRRRTPASVPITEPTSTTVKRGHGVRAGTRAGRHRRRRRTNRRRAAAEPATERRGWITSLLDRLKIDPPKR